MNTVKIALRDGLPIGLGYFAVSFAFGIMAVGSGLTVYEALLISMLNMTSAGQLAALPIIAGGGSLLELALTQLVINSRYSLMSVSLSQSFDKEIKVRDRFIHAFNLTDEMFAVAVGKETPLGRKYLLSLLILPYLGWNLGTLMGAIAGNILPAVAVSALGVSMYAMFIAIVVPVARDSRPVACLTLISIGLSALFYYLPALEVIPDGFVIIIIAIACSLLFALIAPIKDETEGERNSAKQDSTDAKAIKETNTSDEIKEGSKTDASEANDATEAAASANQGKEADSL